HAWVVASEFARGRCKAARVRHKPATYGARAGECLSANSLAVAIAVLFSAAGVHAPGRAADLRWSPTRANSGGSGIWDANSASWYNGTVLLPWNNAASDSATFGGTAGTVTVVDPINVQNLTFSTDGYTLAGSMLAFAGSASTVTTDPGV